jgi:predicted dehydrogenase
MDEIRIGLVGLGHRGLHWLHLLTGLPGYRVTALCDPIPALNERALKAMPAGQKPATFTDYAEFLARAPIDAVALVVRCREQGALAAQALEAGKHVNAEVPAAHTMEDCWRIVLAVERTGKVYQLAEQLRYAGFVAAWRKLVGDGRLGAITFVEGQYFGYYGTSYFFRDKVTGLNAPVSEYGRNPNVVPTFLGEMPSIHYLPHELSPMLKVLDDRVVEVTGMSTRPRSYAHPELAQPDMQVALMKTEKDAILRMAASFAQPHPAVNTHWYQVVGTGGRIEWRRSARDLPKMWLANAQMHDLADVDWRRERTDAPVQARGSGHGDADYYVHATFRDVVLGKQPLEFDVYRAMETAAPAIMAAESIARGSALLRVPDFRPGATRKLGELPAG